MAFFLRLIGFICLVTLLATGTAAANAQSPPAPRAVHGQVINSVTGDAIERARVQIGAQSAVLTDHEGGFTESATICFAGGERSGTLASYADDQYQR